MNFTPAPSLLQLSRMAQSVGFRWAATVLTSPHLKAGFGAMLTVCTLRGAAAAQTAAAETPATRPPTASTSAAAGVEPKDEAPTVAKPAPNAAVEPTTDASNSTRLTPDGATLAPAPAAVANAPRGPSADNPLPAPNPSPESVGALPTEGGAAAPKSPTSTKVPAPQAPSQPEAPLNAWFDVAFVVQSTWNTSPAYDYFAADNYLLMGGLTVALDAAQLTPQTILSVDLTATTGATDNVGPLPQYISQSTLRRTDLGGGLSIRHHIWDWLAPHVRISGGAALEHATVTGADFDQLAVDETNFVGAAGGGFTFYSAAKRVHSTRRYFNSVAFRVNVEGGYQFVGSIPFEVKAATPAGGITRAPIPLGELEQSGPYLRFTAGGRF